MCFYLGARLTPIARLAGSERDACCRIGRTDNVADFLCRRFRGKPRDDVLAQLLDSLRSLGEQRGDHRRRVSRAADSYLDPARRVSSQSSRVGRGSGAERLFHLRPETFRPPLEGSNLNLAESLDESLLFFDHRIGRVKLQSDVKITGS